MKFLCVACDEPMKLTRTAPPDAGGSLTAVFVCPGCGHSIAMLTNPWETEMVTSLGVRIGPATADAAAGAASPPGSVAGAAAAGPAAAAPEAGEGSRCPFSGMVQEMQAAEAASGVAWTDAALARLENIPDFVRPMAKQGVEHYARSNGYPRIDEQVLDEARDRFGM
jgi:hypothetical protein